MGLNVKIASSVVFLQTNKHQLFRWGRKDVGIIIVFLFSSFLSFSQELSAYFKHQRVKMGEPIELKLVVKLPENATIAFEPYDKELPVFRRKQDSQVSEDKLSLEIEGTFKDTTKRIGNQITWIGKYSLVAWDTGKIVLPPQKIIINDSTYLFNETAFTVISATIGLKDELFDIEEGFSDVPEKPTFLQWMKEHWYITAGIILLIAAIVFLIIRRRKQQPKKLQSVMSLKDITLFAITTLDNRKLWSDGHFKQHYTELSHIMRSYLSSRYGLNLLERTTLETKTLLLQSGLPADTVETFMTILRQADMVKFANSVTDELTVLKISMMAKQIVAETSPLELENEEKLKGK